MNVLTRTLKPDWDEANKPVSNIAGDEFEQYVRAVLFPRESYDLLLKTNNFRNNKDDYSLSIKLPDFKYVSKKDGIEFYIEEKFRARFQDQILEWNKFFELKRYQDINTVTPVIIAIGLGGRPSAPERVFLVPARHLKFVKQYPSMMRKYELSPG